MLEAHVTNSVAGPSSASQRLPPVPLYEDMFPELVQEANFRLLNHESTLVTPRPCSPDQPVAVEPQRLSGYRQSLAGLLANTLDSLALCEARAARENNGDEDEDHDCDSDDAEDGEGGCQLNDEDGSNDQSERDHASSIESSEPKTEPFPDYFESCEMSPSVDNVQYEQAYNYAISKVVEEVIRFREVDPCIANPSFSSEEEQSPATIEVEQKTSEQEPTDDNEAQASIEPNAGSSPPPEMYASREESDKMRVVDDMRRILASPYLADSAKGVIHNMSYLVIRMGEILFRNRDSSPHAFMSAGATYDIKMIASEVTRYLAVVDTRLVELLDVGSRVYYILGEVSRDTSVNAFIRYRRMIHVILG